ncbi:DUF4178 domain-containing protein [Larkinella sp. VNQ87]|uniref:DUF4178 domain-containing protein n=1 Tax=Larkinella sp. VNQ87 TaxID=3400921 RepID=UPI003C1204BC
MPTDPAIPETSFNCPHCQAPIPGYDLAESIYFACPQCVTYFRYGDTGPMEIITAYPPLPTAPALSIGSEGYLDGQWVRVTGIMRKREIQYDEPWLEYVLMTKDAAHQMLSEYKGHWMVIRPLEGDFREDKNQRIIHENREYALFNRYNGMILNVVGEFYWNVLEDQHLTVSEYIHPPYLLSREATSQKTEWYKAEYKTPQEIAKAFGLGETALPQPLGVGAIQPSKTAARRKSAGWLATRLALAVVVLQVVFFILKPQKTVFSQSFYWDSDSTQQSRSEPLVSRSFVLDGPAAVGVNLKVDVDNNWLELPVSLIHEQSGQTYEFTRIVEYYHGYEDGESWSEGAQEDEAVLSRIPAGNYHLNFYPSSEGKNRVNFEVKVVQNPILYSNFFLLLFLIALYPIILFIQDKSFEHKRWEQSDYGP